VAGGAGFSDTYPTERLGRYGTSIRDGEIHEHTPVTALPFKLDDWATSLLVDPLSKTPMAFSRDGAYIESDYGRRYPEVDGICDLRLLNNETTPDQKAWTQSQLHYELWDRAQGEQEAPSDYIAERAAMNEVYEAIPLVGSCLDVGGGVGRLRAFLPAKERYLCCDPWVTLFEGLSGRQGLLSAYPFVLEPMNFLCCEAEFLPLRSLCVATVHMRSVLDHFWNPELALSEAYRVLEKDGRLIVGLFVRGGRSGNISLVRRAKDSAKSVLGGLGFHAVGDHHIWHPTYRELLTLLQRCGFRIEKVHWQSGYQETVCYVLARKQPGLLRNGG